jgi:hypothetical protein
MQTANQKPWLFLFQIGVLIMVDPPCYRYRGITENEATLGPSGGLVRALVTKM